MKSTTDVSAEALASHLKCALALNLGKAGHSLYELEEALATKDTEKTAKLLKAAGDSPLSSLKSLFDVASGGLMIGAGTAAAAGGVGAAGLYGAYKGLQDSKKRIDDANAVRQRMDIARRELETELAGHGH